MTKLWVGDGVARWLRRLVEHPVTLLMKGMALVLIGFSDGFHEMEEGVIEPKLRIGHGLILIGLLGVLSAVPPILESLEAGLKAREERKRAEAMSE